jgi:hypothetical protein
MEYKDGVDAVWSAALMLRDDSVRQITIESHNSAKMVTRDGSGLKARIEQAGFRIIQAEYRYIQGDMTAPFWSEFVFEIPE